MIKQDFNWVYVDNVLNAGVWARILRTNGNMRRFIRFKAEFNNTYVGILDSLHPEHVLHGFPVFYTYTSHRYLIILSCNTTPKLIDIATFKYARNFLRIGIGWRLSCVSKVVHRELWDFLALYINKADWGNLCHRLGKYLTDAIMVGQQEDKL